MLLLEDKYAKMVGLFNRFVHDSTQFGTDDGSGECYEVTELADHLYYHAKEYNLGNLTTGCGVSKAVLISDALDCVLKVPFNGMYSDSYNEETGEYDSIWEGFYCGGGDYSDDYCAAEEGIYQMAVKYGVERMFAKTEYFCNLKCGIPVYKQVRVVTYGDSKHKEASPASLEKVNSKYRYACRCNNDWCALIIDFYGEEFFNKFVDFIKYICPEVGEDLHSGNYGYTLDGRPVLLDYSGWGN